MKIIDVFDKYFYMLGSPLGVFQLVSSLIVGFSVLIIFISVLINFLEADKSRGVKREKKSIVETGTMTLFFVIYYLVIKFNIGTFLVNFKIHIILVVLGLILLVLGCTVNVVGRFSLGKNWANQIKIYNDQTLVRGGVYSYVRHPLYASLIWMFFGGSIIYLNYLAFLLNIFVFIPFMYYRAKQEEKELVLKFEDYKDYRKKVGMFFPKSFVCPNKDQQ
jgi:protein-S-isoprenylcysteine O-methyltransferase Ste14